MGCHACNYFTCKPRDFLRHTGTKRHLMKTSQNHDDHGISPQSVAIMKTDNMSDSTNTGANTGSKSVQTTTKDRSSVKRRKRAGKREVNKTSSLCDPDNYVCMQRQISKDEFDDFDILEPHEFDSNLHVTSEDGVFVNLPDIDITDDDDDDDDDDDADDDDDHDEKYKENMENSGKVETIYETIYTNPELVVDMFPNFFHRLFHTISDLLNTTKDTIMDILFEPVQT